MTDDDISLLIDLHRDTARQGPGSSAATRRAIDLAGLRGRPNLRIADFGCGAGAAALILAEELRAQVVAVDLAEPFLDRLRAAAAAAGLSDRIETLAAPMDAPPLAPASLDAIWSEGAIYNIGFARGLRLWADLLKPGGALAVSELTWLTADRPAALQAYWDAHYPDIGPASRKIAELERAGYALLGYFPLSPETWLEGFYDPLDARLDAFVARHDGSAAAQRVAEAERRESALYRAHQAYVSYGFYIAEKR